MQVNRETKKNSPAVHEPVQGRTFPSEGKKFGNATSLDNPRSRRRNRQRKKPGRKRNSDAPVRNNRNVGPSTRSIHHKMESGREFRQSPLKGIKTLFQGSPHSRSNAEMLDLTTNQAYTPPATTCPSRKNHKNPGRCRPSPECQEIKHHQSPKAPLGFSSPHGHEHDSTSVPNGLTRQASPVPSFEKLDPARDADTVTSRNQNQKKRRNRRKNKHERSKRDCIPGESLPGQCSAGQPDVQEARQKSPPLDNVSQTCPPLMANRPPPIPIIKFEVKPDYGSEEVTGSVPNLGQDMVPKFHSSPRKDNAEKSMFPKVGQVVRILQNKNRVTDIGCTQTGNRHMQKSTPQVLSAAKQAQATMEKEHQDPRTTSYSGTGRIRGEGPQLPENKTMVGTNFRKECPGPSPGASSPAIRVSSQDVRHDEEANPRVRRTPRTPRRKPFQKYKGK